MTETHWNRVCAMLDAAMLLAPSLPRIAVWTDIAIPHEILESKSGSPALKKSRT